MVKTEVEIDAFGKSGEDLYIKVPIGTVVKDAETGELIADLSKEGQCELILPGGRGGKGNSHFATSTRQAPRFAQDGEKGIEKEVILELKLLADVGLIGFPSVGKSTILSRVTSARPKIADYHFTTLEPNLGVVKTEFGDSFVLADIPGIIEGASEGTGLGLRFLRHIERTRLLLHVIDVSGSEGRNPVDDFNTINKELKKYSEKLSTRKQIIVANKIDAMQDETLYEQLEKLAKEKNIEMSIVEGWEKGGEGAIDIAKKIVKNCSNTSNIKENNFNFIYKDEETIKEKIQKVATKIYGAQDVEYSEEAEQKIEKIEKTEYGKLPVCIAKTQYSFSDDTKNLECNNKYNIHVRDVELKAGAGFIVVLAGKIMTMPGLPKIPAAEQIDIDENDNIIGIF